ncbi:CGNR zinc finger domain-containing protein [Galbitalea sp. SE-J8]|uniref:CGNR zinc finger domain-containing protein n=1 Tax=Galbitalea sp. SE-J8 TaxID=3054952 RepID=UPI00259CDA7B|nr:CGNR zinc finger domain-containing protein [Galbitalea sp. SE-J8]MDM4763823.1 CGNR zinc finger domain-containing protein [Galbitalea sp. SE-J8]
MHFAPDTIESLDAAVALCNTAAAASRSRTEELADVDALLALLDRFRYSGRRDRDEPERLEVLATRARLRALWRLTRDDAAAEVNTMLADARAMPFLIRHDGYDWHLHATSLDAPLAERIRVETAMALLDVIRDDEWERLRECAAPDCDGVFTDFSRNGSKRFCSVRCGNRVNQVLFRERGRG